MLNRFGKGIGFAEIVLAIGMLSAFVSSRIVTAGPQNKVVCQGIECTGSCGGAGQCCNEDPGSGQCRCYSTNGGC